MDDESVSRARWRFVDDKLQRLEQAAGLPNPTIQGGGPVARTPEEVDALIGQMEGRQDAAEARMGAMEADQAARAEEVNHRFERLTNLVDRLQTSLRGVEDRTDANCERLNAHDQRLNAVETRTTRATNPVMTLLVGVLGLICWLVISLWLKAQVGDNLRVWHEGEERLWRDHPDFGDLTMSIIGAGAAFIVGMTVICLIIDLINRRKPQQVRPATTNPPPPIVTREDLENGGGDQPPAQEQQPTQVRQPAQAD